MTSIFRIVFTVTICLFFLGCANFDKYYKNPFYRVLNNPKHNQSKQVVDSNRFKIKPFNSDPEQISYANNVSRIMTDFGLTVVENIDTVQEESASRIGNESVAADETTSKIESTLIDKAKENTISEPSLINADNNEKYIIDTMFIKETDGSVTFTRLSDKKVMGTFSISPYVFKMRPQLYAALVNMKLLKGVRYL